MFVSSKTILSILVLMTTYKAFIRPYVNYDGIVYDQAYNYHSLKIRKNTIQWLFSYNMGDSWHFKIEINVLSVSIIPRRILPCITRNIDTVPLFNTTHTFYKN